MAIRTIEARLERMSVNDENEPANGAPIHVKPKVLQQLSLHYRLSLTNPEEFSIYSITAFRTCTHHPADFKSQSFKSPEICLTEQQ